METPAETSLGRQQAQDEHERQLKALVEETIRYEKLYLHDHLTFKDLSAATGISQLRLHTLFGENRSYTTLNEYINRRFRIPMALRMLHEHPDYTIEAIAHECGYQNMKTFFNWFHREMNMTPRRYSDAMESGELKGETTPPIPLPDAR